MTKNNPQVHEVKNPSFTRFAAPAPSEQTGGTVSDSKRRRATDGEQTPDDNVKDLLGDMQYSVMSRNLDLYQGYPHTTTGIPYAIEGTAKVINVAVGEYLAGFKDPIKLILSTNVHTEDKVIIRRKFVVGGRSMITPEHAPARTVAIQEDVREVRLTRFGGDIEMNLNLFLRKSEAKEELDMKVGAQKRELERTLIDMGYDMLMSQGTDLVDAVIRSNPLYSHQAGVQNPEIVDAADRINIQQVFGAMSKHAYPVQNLLAAARYASAYTTTNAKGSVLILPHGVHDILRYTRREAMVYEVAGPALMSQTNGKKISMPFEDAYTDTSTSVKIVVHRQMPNFDGGTAHPDVGMGGLTGLARFGNFYRDAPLVDEEYTTKFEVVDFEKGTWRDISKPSMMNDGLRLKNLATTIAAQCGQDTSDFAATYKMAADRFRVTAACTQNSPDVAKLHDDMDKLHTMGFNAERDFGTSFMDVVIAVQLIMIDDGAQSVTTNARGKFERTMLAAMKEYNKQPDNARDRFNAMRGVTQALLGALAEIFTSFAALRDLGDTNGVDHTRSGPRKWKKFFERYCALLFASTFGYGLTVELAKQDIGTAAGHGFLNAGGYTGQSVADSAKYVFKNFYAATTDDVRSYKFQRRNPTAQAADKAKSAISTVDDITYKEEDFVWLVGGANHHDNCSGMARSAARFHCGNRPMTHDDQNGPGKRAGFMAGLASAALVEDLLFNVLSADDANPGENGKTMMWDDRSYDTYVTEGALGDIQNGATKGALKKFPGMAFFNPLKAASYMRVHYPRRFRETMRTNDAFGATVLGFPGNTRRFGNTWHDETMTGARETPWEKTHEEGRSGLLYFVMVMSQSLSNASMNAYRHTFTNMGNATFTDVSGGSMAGDNLFATSEYSDEMIALRPNVEAMMSSAILAAPGEETGSLLVGYPFTSVSTSSQEMVKIQMRVYLGCVLKSPESVIVLRDVYFEGLKSGHRFDADVAFMDPTKDLTYAPFPALYLNTHANCIDYADFQDDSDEMKTNGSWSHWITSTMLHGAGILHKGKLNPDDGRPTKLYAGSCRSTLVKRGDRGGPQRVAQTVNAGHMGCLDDPSATSRLWGSFVYSPNPAP